MPYALITGATSGIGLAIARQLKGYDLVLASRDEARMRELQTEFGPRTLIVSADLSKHGSALQLFERCRGLEIEVVVCNAGFGRMGAHLDHTPDDVTGVSHLNVTSLVELCSLFGRPMRERKRGYLLTVASIAGFLPLPYFAEYAATKAFVIAFSRALTEELKPHGVTVTCLCPGPTDTNFRTRAHFPSSYSSMRTMSAEDVARMGLEGLWRARPLVIPGGPRNQLVAYLGRLIPQPLLAWYFRRRLDE